MKLLVVFSALLYSILCCVAQPYMLAYFSNNPGLHLAYSYDAEDWVEIKQKTSFFMPDKENSKNCFRDPCVYKGQDGTFHMMWTVGYSDSFGYSSSKDLIHWTPQQRIPIMKSIPTTKNVWAPEIFYDENSDLYYVYWSSTVESLRSADSDKTNDKGWDHRIYYATTKDFVTYSEPKLYFDPGYTVIDASIIEIRGRYAMLIKDERRYPEQKNIRISFSKNLSEGFPTELSAPLTNNKVAWAEGPAPLKVGRSTYVYYDKYCQGKYGAIKSRRGRRWRDVSDRCTFPKGIRHCSALSVSQNQLNAIIEAAKKH